MKDVVTEWVHDQLDEIAGDEYTLQSPIIESWVGGDPARVSAQFTVSDKTQQSDHLKPRTESHLQSVLVARLPDTFEYRNTTFTVTYDVTYDPPTDGYPHHGDVRVQAQFEPRHSVGHLSRR